MMTVHKCPDKLPPLILLKNNIFFYKEHTFSRICFLHSLGKEARAKQQASCHKPDLSWSNQDELSFLLQILTL